MIGALPPGGIITAVSQYVDTCRQLNGIPALRSPLARVPLRAGIGGAPT
jgi:hypothetical protein